MLMQKRIFSSLVVLWTVVSAAFVHAQTSFAQFNTPDSYIDNLLEKLLNEGTLKWGKKAVVQRFCTHALNARMVYSDEVSNTLIYDPRQSVFLYTLCRHVEIKEELFAEALTKESGWYLKLRKLEDFGLICETRDDGVLQPKWCIPGCSATDAMANKCDFSALLPDLMSILMNDYSNGALALVYGVYDTEDKNLDDLANDFGFQHLDGVFYTDKFLEYPNTHSYLKKHLKRARKLTTKTKMIDLPVIMAEGRKLTKEDCGNTALQSPDKMYNLFACPYSNASVYGQNRIKFAGYTNLMYNEVMWYQLFVNYYAYMLQANKIWLQDFAITQRATESWDKIDYEIMKLKKDVAVHQEAIKTSLRMLTNIHATFSVHIWFQMYYEEVKKFRNALAKIYTPIHQLYYKLRNVQAER